MSNLDGYVALICRISKDKSGRVEGVKNQERWGRDYAARTWPGVPVRVFSDNNLSASDGTERPEFEAFRAALGRGEVAHVWAVEQSRLERREAEWFRLAAELDAAGIVEVHTNRDGIVRVRDEVAGIKAVLNAAEVRKMKRRLRDRNDADAGRGLPQGGRPFGYQQGLTGTGERTLVIVEAEAELIRESAERILAGWSQENIAKDLRARGIHGGHRVKVRDADGQVLTEDGTPVEDGGTPMTRPSRIVGQTIRSWVTSPTVAGQRVHRGVTVGAGNWPAILDPATAAAVRHRLAAPRVVDRIDGGTYPVKAAPQRNARRYLLTGGTSLCAVCEAPLIATMKQLRKGQARAYYLCHPNRGGKGCIGIGADAFEEYVVARLFAELDKPAFLDAVAADEYGEQRDRITTDLEALDGRRNEMARQRARDEITLSEWQAARAELSDLERTLRAELAATPPPTSNVDIDAAREGWPFMTLDERRDFLGMFVESVTVQRATTRGFDENRVSVVWR